ncbi:hypothetical protein AN958_03029 [Leucoagaricus sp. SymC.cos]|nr:hypothetical protein AN958_03029 [Leucoagaricus sp. SymC.cos]
MQHPTCTNIRIRSVHDAHKIFYAVQQGLLQMVTRRLDADERMQLRTGCVYAWEERGPHTELTGLGIERFTEGRRWSPSRVRDVRVIVLDYSSPAQHHTAVQEFLFYYEKYSPSPDCADPHPPRDWDPLVKQTYSVWVETEKGRRKWHLTAYFTQETVDQLGSIDDVRVVRDLVVPDNIFASTRVTKSRNKHDENRAGESSKSTNTSAAGTSRFAPFPAPNLPNQPESSGQILMYQPYPNHDTSVSQHKVQGDAETTLAQRLPPIRPTNSNPTNAAGFRVVNQYHSQNYRPLLPSSHPRTTVDHLHRNIHDYNSVSQQIPLRFGADAQHPYTSLAQARPGGDQISPSHSSHPVHPQLRNLPVNVPPPTSHSNVDPIQPYTSNTQPFPSISTGWAPVNSGALDPQNSSIYYGDNASSYVTSAANAAQNSSSYPSHEITAGPSPDSFQTMAPYLNPLHEDFINNPARREPLPPLSILQETYAFSYDFSVSMVDSTGSESLSDALSEKPSEPSSEPSQKSKTVTPGPNKPGGGSRDLDLVPLNSLARRQPYRREPVDDRALRLLWTSVGSP